MTDLELNKAIAEALRYEVSDIMISDISSDLVIKKGDLIFGSLPNYCRDWSALMPLVVENYIQMFVHARDHYTIDDGDVNGFCRQAVHKDLIKRVLAECVLKVLTKQNDFKRRRK